MSTTERARRRRVMEQVQLRLAATALVANGLAGDGPVEARHIREAERQLLEAARVVDNEELEK